MTFRSRGRVTASASADTATNSATCAPIPAPKNAPIRAAALPATNQMDTSPAVRASTMPKTTMAPSQSQSI